MGKMDFFKSVIEGAKDLFNQQLNEVDLLKKEIKHFNKKIEDLSSSYTDYYKVSHFIEKQKKISQKISFLNMLVNSAQFDTDLSAFKLYTPFSLPSIIEKQNKHFIENELKSRKEYFENLFKYPLDDDQKLAIVTDECDTLVIAGAGCGKTSTILGKIKYLIDCLCVDPKDIVAISFSNDSVQDLDKRLKEYQIPVTAYTFHAYAHQQFLPGIKIAHKPDTKLTKAVIDYFKSIVDVKEQRKILHFFSVDIYNMIQQKTVVDGWQENENIETIKSKILATPSIHEKFTGKHEYVHSKEEVVIANFLYLNGINYEYEKCYPHKIETDDGRKIPYNPDFYLPDYDIYLEHFGVGLKENATNETDICNYDASHLGKNGYEYVFNIQKKRDFHTENKTKLIESYSFWNQNGKFIERLSKLLESNNIKFTPMPDEMIQSLYSNYVIQEVNLHAAVFAQFINLFKANGFLSFSELSSKQNAIEKFFLSISEKIYHKYQDELGDEIDFNDIINLSTSYIKNNEIAPFKYLIVDEFQDINKGRFLFLKALQDKIKCKIFAVGDDWQSIYRFNGSDVSFFKNFEMYFGEKQSKSVFIRNTYRNSQTLINIAGSFIMKNSSQVKKQLVSQMPDIKQPVYVCRKCREYGKYLKRVFENVVKNDGPSASIMILSRYNKDNKTFNLLADELGSDFNFDKKTLTIKSLDYPGLKIKFMTCHASKGLESDNVVILLTSGTWGFPNQIEDNQMLRFVLAEKDNHEFAEERRLFYVALTRAKKRVYILSKEFYGAESCFTKEIQSIIKKQEEKKSE